MYQCPICGKQHDDKDICPQVKSRLFSPKFMEKHTNYMIGIFYMCEQKKLPFSRLISELGYMMFFWDHYREKSIKLPTILSPDLFLSYAAVYCGCNVSDFILSEKKAVKYIISLLNDLEVYQAYSEKEGWYVGYTCHDHGRSIEEDAYDIFIEAKYENDTIKYSLSLHYPYSGIISDNGNYMFLNNDSQGNSITLFQTYDNSFREIYEDNFEDLAIEIKPDDKRRDMWIEKIKKATSSGSMIWKKLDSLNLYYYSYYGEYPVTIKPNYKIDISNTTNDRLCLYILLKNTSYDVAYYLRADFTELIDMIDKSIKANKKASKEKATTEIVKHEIQTNSVLVLFHSWVCHDMQHKVEMVIGVVKMYAPRKGKFDHEVHLGYCPSCKRYMLLYSEYYKMLKLGKPLCVIVENTLYVSKDKADFSACQDESLLYGFGYSAQKTEKERRAVIDKVIKADIISAFETKNFLHWLKTIHSTDKKYKNAVSVWGEDIEYIDKNYTNKKKKTRIDKMTVNVRKKTETGSSTKKKK